MNAVSVRLPDQSNLPVWLNSLNAQLCNYFAAAELTTDGFLFSNLKEEKEMSHSWIPLTTVDKKAEQLPSLHLDMFHQI